MRKVFRTVLVATTMAAGLSCSGSPEDAVQALIQENVRASDQEDLDAVMATMHKDSPQFDKVLEKARRQFTFYDLSHHMVKSELVAVSDTEARVLVIMEVRRISGPGFQNSRLTLMHTLRKQNSRWKIFSTQLKTMKVL